MSMYIQETNQSCSNIYYQFTTVVSTRKYRTHRLCNVVCAVGKEKPVGLNREVISAVGTRGGLDMGTLNTYLMCV